MLKINEFAKLCECSSRTLRYYHEMNVLVPEVVDEKSGYRFYNEAQLEDFTRIRQLQKAGFTIEEIAENQHDQDKMYALYEEKLDKWETTLDEMNEMKDVLFPQKKDEGFGKLWCGARAMEEYIHIFSNCLFQLSEKTVEMMCGATLELLSDASPVEQLINQTKNSLVDLGYFDNNLKGFEHCGWKYETHTGFKSLKELYDSIQELPEKEMRKSFHVLLLNGSMYESVEEVKQFLADLESKGYLGSKTNYIFGQDDQCESTYMVLYSTLTLDEAYKNEEMKYQKMKEHFLRFKVQ